MLELKKRLNKELVELLAKKGNLEAFIGTKKYHELSEVQRSLLIVQKDAMETYASCLYQRIHNL